MPELPEVETFARNLHPALIGKTILASELLWQRTLASPSKKAFTHRIKSQRISAIGRRAKYLVLTLTDYVLLMHLRMSGDVLAVLGGYQKGKHDRLILHLSEDTKLVFSDPRKFGRIWLVRDPDEVLRGLGPEPLGDEFTAEWLVENLHTRSRQLKMLLMDQSFIAGLGNIYTDEILHAARLHPMTKSDAISNLQAGHLWQAIRIVLEDGIRRSGASIDWVYRGGDFQNHFRVYGRSEQPCPVCGTAIRKITVGQRGTHYCPTCQPLEA